MSAESRDAALREMRTTREAAGLYDYSARGKVVVSGADRIEFLQGMLTSDVAALPEGRAQRSAIVTAMGKMIANLLLLKRRDDVLLETPPGRAQVVVETLAKYIITEDVELADRTSELAILSVHGPCSTEILKNTFATSTPTGSAPSEAAHDSRTSVATLFSAPEDAFAFRELAWNEAPAVILRHDRFRLPGYDVWAPSSHADGLREALLRGGAAHGFAVCGDDARETLRIAAGRPAWGREITEDNFPGEVGLSTAVSVTKGCYVGQEVLSRIHNLGHVNRVLVCLSLEDRIWTTPTTLWAGSANDSDEVGVLTSIAPCAEENRRAALGLVRTRAASVGNVLVARAADGAEGRASITSTIA